MSSLLFADMHLLEHMSTPRERFAENVAIFCLRMASRWSTGAAAISFSASSQKTSSA